MIDRREILAFASELSLRPNIVEKDYVLGWLLAGIFHSEAISKSWVFKGGTCLKKCYFETYRFSEDLDFTVPDSSHIKQDFLVDTFKAISAWVYEQSGIELPIENIQFEVYQNPRGKLSAQGKVSYRGPIAPQGDLPRIKLDLTCDEILILPATSRVIYHPYSDGPAKGFQILCYSCEELFAEKLRALLERGRPRDLYDVVHIFQHQEILPDAEVILSTLQRKCEFKGVPVPMLESFWRGLNRIELKSEWSNMLAHQLSFLPPFEPHWQMLPSISDWLHNKWFPFPLSSFPPMVDEDTTWAPPAMAHAWHMNVPLEAIRFAGANRLCVALGYRDTIRIIEPYSLRRSKAGELLLYAIRVDNRTWRAYRVDQIQTAKITDKPFEPVFAIEFALSGLIKAPKTKFSAQRHTSTRKPSRQRKSDSPSSATYVIECTLCKKQFHRKKYDTTLRPHKNKDGRPCHSRHGILKDTRYN